MSKKEKKASILKRFTPYMGKKKNMFPIALTFSFFSAILAMLPFIFIWLVVREIFMAAQNLNADSVALYAWLSAASIFASLLIYFLALTASHLAAFHVEVEMRQKAMQKIMNMPLGYFDRHSSGKVRKIIDDGTSTTHTFLAHQMPDLYASIAAPLILIAVLFVFDWKMGIACLIPIGLGFFSMSFMMSVEGKKFRQEYMNYLEEMSSESVEYVRGIPVVKTFGQSVFAFKKFYNSIIKYRDMVYAYTIMWVRPMSFYTAIMQSTAFFLVPLVIFLFGHGYNMAAVLTDFLFYLLIAPQFSMMLMRSMYFNNYKIFAEDALNRFEAVLDYPQLDTSLTVHVPQNYDIEFKNLYFAYDGAEKNAVDGISFTVRTGQRAALVGASGGGKTTIARLAARFWEADEGEVLIGGVNVKNIAHQKLMEYIAFVFQNTKLFKTSLRENIVYGKENANEADIQKAIELSQSKDIINALPDGLNTVIGTKGTYLSGGEQQRIVLARAFLKDAPIVLLDEATAFADPENEQLIQKALKELSKGKTTLMIAHRLTSVVDADMIFVVAEGKIVEQGSHKDLLSKEGVYTDMWNEYQKSISWKL